MSAFDQKLCAWGGVACAALFGAGLLLAGFVPPPSPSLSAAEVAAYYREHAGAIRGGMMLGLFGMAGWTAFVGVISAQMRRMQTGSDLPALLQVGAGSIGVLTVMLPIMIFAATAFRPERDPALTQLLNDLGWLIIIPAFPTFIAQFGAIALGTWRDRSPHPVFPRWAAYFNLWMALLFVPGGLAYFFRSGPFAWDGLFDFWLAAGAFFAWLMVMTPLVLKAIAAQGEG
ncbi:MAG: hypothetical protein KGL44_06685 [Sphingomonadales bacterium]|nr:hypothetical protein [Sphingomonadales bacterium]